MYKAIDIAKYIINKCIDNSNPISNLQLQKILYYTQGEYIKKTNKFLFADDIEAWQYGPVVPEVYYEYNNYSASCIRDKQSEMELDINVKKIIDPIIRSKSLVSAWKLVKDTHSESPWRNTYVKDEKRVITSNELKSFFVG